MNKKKSSTVLICILTFFISCISMIIIYALIKIYPFGTKTILTMDMSGQYVNYLAYFRNIFYDGANIFYNFSMNLGSNCYGLFAYYLSSPLNIILCFFKETHITEAILLLNIIKVALCASTMTILLSKTTNLSKFNVVLLSIMYSLMSYNIVYSQNIMWLDGVIYLPLVILGIEKIIKEQKYNIYIIFLFLTIVANFYVGYMVGLFSLFFAIIRIIQESTQSNIKCIWKENKKSIVTYFKATIIALLLSSIVLLPVLLNLLNSKSDIQAGSFSFDTYYSPLDAISKIGIGAFNNNELVFGAPNIYCGTLCLVLAILYFNNKKIKNRDKILYLILFMGLMFCYIMVPLNLIFHMLQSPVWFPFRNSFLSSFILVFLAAKSMEKIKTIDFNTFLKGQLLIVFLIVVLNKFNYEYVTNTNTVLTIAFTLITGIMYYYSKNKGKLYKIVVIILVMLEMIINGYQITKQIGYVERSNFIESYYKIKDVIEKYKSTDADFYRIENEVKRTINDPMLYNYNGFSHYSSVSGKANKNFLTNFGIRHNLIPENPSDTTLPMATILGIKYYMINPKDISNINMEWFNKIEGNENITVLENKYALNLGFLVSDEVKKVQIKYSDPLENQNELFSKMVNSEEKIFDVIEVNDISQIENQNQDELYLVYSIENASTNNSVKIYFDDNLYNITSEINKDSNNIIYIPATVKKIRIEINEEDKDLFKYKLYCFNNDTFDRFYKEISQNQLQVEVNHSNYIKGKINAKRDGTLLTSIINDNGWKVKVDGKKVEKQIVAENILAIDISKGEHIIEFTYIPSGFTLGLVLFIIGLLLLLYDVARIKLEKNGGKENAEDKR